MSTLLRNFKYLRNKFRDFLEEKHTHPLLAIFFGSIYALLYYYDRNYALINSKSQFLFLVSLFFILPTSLFYVVSFILKRSKKYKDYKLILLSTFNLSCFFLTIVISLFGFDYLKLLIALFIGVILGALLKLHLKKIIVIQVILTLMVLPKLIPDFYREITYSKEWMEQLDSIEKAEFKKRPNIYIIQPDGYTSFSTFKDSLHRYDNSKFKNFLENNRFKTYDHFRSNYFSTLSSNSSLFAMKHHYYGNKDLGINPRHNRRNEIVESNPVLRTLKHNNYKTFLMLQVPYILANRPNVDFDYCNISLDDVSYIARGFSGETNLLVETKDKIKENKDSSNFFFIESMLPSHVVTHYNAESSVENERQLYIERIEEANKWLTDLISFINTEDPNALVVVAADHGGFVGFNHSLESMGMTENPLLRNSIFSSLLAIKWPQNEVPDFDSKIKTTVNLFRILFTYLSEDDTYLKHLQEDKSYKVIRKNAPTGVYEYIDEHGENTFSKV